MTRTGFNPAWSPDGREIAFATVRMDVNPQNQEGISELWVWLTTGSRLWSNPDPSPDGQSVAFYSRVEPEGDLYVSRPDGTGQRQSTSDAALDRMPRWSPDGQWITCFPPVGQVAGSGKIRP